MEKEAPSCSPGEPAPRATAPKSTTPAPEEGHAGESSQGPEEQQHEAPQSVRETRRERALARHSRKPMEKEAASSRPGELVSHAMTAKSATPVLEGGHAGESNQDPEEQRHEAPQSVPYYKLYAFADCFDMALVVVGIAGSIVNGGAMPIMSLLFGSLIDAFGKNSMNVDSVVHQISKISLKFVYLGAGAAMASFAQLTCWMLTGERQASRIRRLYLKAILRQEIGFFDIETSTGEVVGRMSGDTVLIQEAMGEKVGKFLQLVSTFVGGFIVAFIRGWKLTLVMLSVIPLLVFAGGIMAFLITKTSSKGQEAYAEAGDVVEQAIGSIRTVVSFTGENKTIEKYQKSLKRAYKSSIQQGLASGFGTGFVFMVMFSAYGLAFWYGAKLIINQGYTGGRIINVILSILIGAMSLGKASPSVNAFAAGQAAAWKMFEVIYRVPRIDVSSMDGLIFDTIRGDIEFESVDFAYPSRPDVQIFSSFSLHIPKGITAALVGESGSGKSTVVSLIERFYDPTGGKVMLDGTDIRHLQLKWLRQQIGLVSQEPVLFGTSIKENILYGKDGATFDEIKSAAELANAANFIEAMPQGFDTMVGERGAQLSGGQKQRIAIARAIIKNPHILLLDEATSALDAESERLVQDALDRAMVNCTTLVVAHRLTTVRNADLIAVLQQGAIVEMGKHGQLIQKTNGAYSQLLHLQQIYDEKQQHACEGTGLSMPLSVESSDDFGSSSLSRSLTRSANSSFGGSGSYSSGNKQAAATVEAQLSEKRNCLLRWFCMQSGRDFEVGENNTSINASLLRLASLNKPEAPIYIVGTLAAMLNGAVLPLFGLLLSSIIKVFYESPRKLRKDADFWASMFVILAASYFVILPTQMLCFAIGGARLIQRVRLLAFKRLLHQEISWFDRTENSSGAAGARLSTDAAHLKSMVGDALALIVQNGSTIVAGLVIAFTASWQMTVVVLAVVPLLGLQGIMQLRLVQGFSTDAKEMYEEASQVVNDAVGSIRTVASYGREEKVLALYADKCKVPLRLGIQQGLISGVAIAFSNFVMFSAYAICFWFGSKLVHQKKTTFQEIFRVFFTVSVSAVSVTQSTSLIPDLAKLKSAASSVSGLLDCRSGIDSSDASGRVLESVVGDIEFNHVSFMYPSRPGVHVLRDLSLQVHAGTTLALVGESGSGKSTVIALLERFYDPGSGHILLDGVDIRTLQLKWLRQQMGLVSQEPVLFNDTIEANIGYGADGAASYAEVIAAAEASNAHEFISALPNGYRTCVGERGVQLSGGQKQRVAIARVMLRSPRVVLLDEATSALDAESECAVQAALDNMMANRTALMIAHRLSTIKNADTIAVVKEGGIMEEGKHEMLISIKNGAYASLVKLHMDTT